MSLPAVDETPAPSGPLSGLRVLDCSHGTAGPRVTAVLADYGAEVVWVERPGGDVLRRREPAAVSVLGRGKRSVTVDLADVAERRILLEQMPRFDVFVESWRPGKAAELELGYETLAASNPALIYCSISGFGQSGSLRDVPGFEPLVHALAGTMAEQAGHRDGPIFQGLPFASIGAGYLGAIGVLAALYRRQEDGRGRWVETSLLDGALAYHNMLWGESDASVARGTAQLSLRQGTSGTRLITRTFECSDGQYLGVHTGAVGAFGRLMKVLGLDDRIAPSPDGMDIGKPLTPDQQSILETETFRLFLSRPRSYWLEKLLEADVCAIEHLHPTEVFDQAQARHNDMVFEIDDPVLGRIEQVGPAAKFALHPPARPRPCPPAGGDGSGASAIPPGDPWLLRPSSEGQATNKPLLDGVTILDLGAYYAGPYSSRLLADLGADVIKLEPTQGDQLRGLERPFFSAQAGKRSLAADLKAPELSPVVERLLAWAQVVHHNMRPGAAERLGLDYETVTGVNPDVIYLYAPGWGATGPHMTRQSFAPMLSGYVGVSFEVAGRFNEPMPSCGNEDPGNGLVGAVAILMALLGKRRHGQGQYVENPQLNAAMAHMAHIVRDAAGEAIGAGRLDTLQMGFSALERLYRTSDGWLCLVAHRDRDLHAVAKVTGVEILGDNRFADEPSRRQHDYDLGGLLEGAFETRPTKQVLGELLELGVPAAEPVGPNMHALMNDPEHRRSGRIAEVAHPRLGMVRELGPLVRVSGCEQVPHRLAPELGEHSESILAEFGFHETAIALLKEKGTVR
jgi:crotonobetainyl-CoA:carnitine CoA-transferase CaiB-like acyl-CoA transferase